MSGTPPPGPIPYHELSGILIDFVRHYSGAKSYQLGNGFARKTLARAEGALRKAGLLP